jgi:hypothetical protein
MARADNENTGAAGAAQMDGAAAVAFAGAQVVSGVVYLGAQPRTPRRGNKWAVKEIIDRIHLMYSEGIVPCGTTVAAVKRKISDKNFRPGWDAVKRALIALGYILPKD